MRKLIFVSGLAVGFVIGTRAGREWYDRMKRGAQRVAENPAVRNAAESAAQGGRQAAGKALHVVGDQAQRIRSRRDHNGHYAGQSARYEDDDWGTSNT
ncbi:YtxH domain-containing protein [Streptomyces sp. NPDC101160]|uniref:YtxH domain-containing protein n=1 Tax=Streptomyces sp. NPDC101160 TaxID=3366118 RepID=UPI0038295575